MSDATWYFFSTFVVMKKSVPYIVLVILAIVLSSCKKDPIRVSSVSLNKTSIELIEGGSETLIATVLPEDAENPTVTWISSNTQVASVSNGTVTAITVGQCFITATAGGKSAECLVNVSSGTIPVENVSLDMTELSLLIGEEHTLTAILSPSNATNKNVSWSSSAESITTVDQNGKVVAISDGTAKITVTTEDGGKTADCIVSVTHTKTYDELIVGVWDQTKLESYDADGQLTETKSITDITVMFNSDSTCVGLIILNPGQIVPTCPYIIVSDTLRIKSPFVVEFIIQTLDETDLLMKTVSLAQTGEYSICYYSRKKEFE